MNKKFGLAALVIGSLVSCSESAGPHPVISIQGVVKDSLAAKPVPGVLVELGLSTAMTDVLGAYKILNVAPGSYTLIVRIAGFDGYAKALTLSAPGMVQDIALRRIRPFVTSYATANNSTVLTATVVDLQGEGTISSSQSTVFYSYNGGSSLAGLAAATRTALDLVTARFQVNTGQAVTSQTRWVFNDTGGNRSEFLCSAGSGCVEQ